jgi:hypothetical protein
MIKERKATMIFLSAGVILGLMSCDGEGAESIYDLDKTGEINEIQKEIIETAGDISVFEITLTSSDELETSINEVDIITNEGASEGTLSNKIFQLSEDVEPSISVIDSEFSVRVYQKNEPQLISEIDFNMIEKNFDEAKKQIPSEFVDHALYEYIIEYDENKRADRFTINTLMEDENNHLEGGDLVTNYYEFNFELDEKGNVVMLEQ